MFHRTQDILVNILLLFIFPFVNFQCLRNTFVNVERLHWEKKNVVGERWMRLYWKRPRFRLPFLKFSFLYFIAYPTSLENYITLILQKDKIKKKLHRRIRVLRERQKVCNFISFLLFDKLINSFCRWNKMHDLSPSHNGQTDLPDPQSVCGSSPLSAV